MARVVQVHYLLLVIHRLVPDLLSVVPNITGSNGCGYNPAQPNWNKQEGLGRAEGGSCAKISILAQFRHDFSLNFHTGSVP